MTPSVMTALIAAAGVIAGAIASLAGFGIGSVLTPVFALSHGTKLAVAAVSIPHVAGTALRFLRLKEHVDRRVFLGFGLMSLAGGLTGALLNTRLANPALTAVFAGLLVFSGLSGLTGLAKKLRFHGAAAWAAGGLSGFFGGLVGNQGGIRSASMLGFEISKEAFVATATAVALLVDGARMPVYLATQGREILGMWPLVAVATGGVLLGTLLGGRLLRRVPEKVFGKVVSSLVLVLGLFMLVRALG
ncbi:MAG TPA: sulfite exporter TauE/SafE family protein [Thermoanaerobaculia bacterium]|nr:sulfite exporter TauE/SafE family protein [Thermoanaerobaculia bacterium]